MRPSLVPQKLTALCTLSRQRYVAAQLSRCPPRPAAAPIQLIPHSSFFSSSSSSSYFGPIVQSKPANARTLSTTGVLSKKGNKSAKGNESETQGHTATSLAGGEDVFDFSELEADLAKALAKLKDDLSKLRAGGRFNPDIVDNLRVTLEKSGKDTVRLGDLAQVVPKGRILNIIAGEKDHIKAISSAIQSSDLSLTPQTDPQNPLQLNVPIPPPTKESRQQAVQAATKAAEISNTAIRNARQAQQKKLRGMQLSKAARPDDLKKAGDKMEKVVERGLAEAKKIADSAKKVLESG